MDVAGEVWREVYATLRVEAIAQEFPARSTRRVDHPVMFHVFFPEYSIRSFNSSLFFHQQCT